MSVCTIASTAAPKAVPAPIQAITLLAVTEASSTGKKRASR